MLALVCAEPSLNVWIIADLENYGLSSDILDMWGEFRGNALQAVVLRFFDNYVAYTPDRMLPDGLVAVLHERRPRVLSGAATTIHTRSDQMGFQTVTSQYLSELKPDTFRPRRSLVEVLTATTANAKQLHDLAQLVPEFAGGPLDGWLRPLSNPRVRTHDIGRDSRIVSTASTNIECSTSAMIGGVMTHPDYRGRGLGSACMSNLCMDLLIREGLLPNLPQPRGRRGL